MTTLNHPLTARFDLIVVGSGPNGTIVANEVYRRRKDVSILVVETGPEISANAGEHLIESPDKEARQAYERLMRLAKQIEYVQGSAADRQLTETLWTKEEVGIVPAAYLGNDMREFPGAAMAWNIGGMGVHWTAACPRPFGPEIPPAGDGDWDDDLRTAQRLLRVDQTMFAANPFAHPVLDSLRAALPQASADRSAQPMPIAGVPGPTGKVRRTGPRDIFPELFSDDDRARLVTGALCTTILHRDGAATGVVLRDVQSGQEVEVAAAAVVVAADALRTPQLLWTSGIRPDALGVRLNEHASIDGGVVVDPVRIGAAGLRIPEHPLDEPFIGAYWSPSNGADQPTQGQLLEQNSAATGHTIGMGWYVSTEIRPENRLEFSEHATDAVGLPRITAHFSYSDRDLERIEFARGIQRAAASAIGDFHADSAVLLPAGASLHYTGTVRMGAADDGASVCDLRGAVWGFDNLFVAGNGVIPTALTCNATLTSASLSVRTARSVLA
jgi:choline dehydrogenase-like flavoprotein